LFYASKKLYNLRETTNSKINKTMKGKIKYYNAEESWGKLGVEASLKDIYFNKSNISPELMTLLEFDKFKDEPISFDIAESTRRKGEKEAVNINIDFETRRIGTIHSFDSEKGFGKIEDFHSKEKIFFHYSGIKKAYAGKYERVEVEDPVIFTIGSNEKGPCCIDIVKIDYRSHIEAFAIFDDLKHSLIGLKGMAEAETWDYIKKPTRGVPVLSSFINQSCLRLQRQKKIVKGKSSKDKTEYCYFNTGLVTPQQDEIFAYFIKNPKYYKLEGWGLQAPEWKFIEFNTDQSVYRRYFSELPEIATYFSEAEVTDLIFDTRVPIIPDKEHLLKRKSRIESERIKSLDDEAFIEEIKDAIELAKKRIKRNYKTAIPHFYDNRIQFLIPLCFRSNKAEAVAALVVNKNENIHEAHTILSLDQAYNNARLLAKPDREWLNP
jgi:cold shock CspA family protein